jgi:ABC-type multidrug transport system fused ATPase/permease subunit
MALSIRQAAPAEGMQWMRDAFRLFTRRPLPFTGMFVAFLVVALLVTIVPLAGGLLMLMSLPLLSLGFMLASRAAQNDLPLHPGLFVEALRGERTRRNAVLALCATYALSTMLIMTLSEWIDGGSFERLQHLMAKGDEGRAEMEAILADPRLVWGLVTRFGLAACLSVPFWHAPALVYWQGQGVGQALFSSTLALWRCKGAFLVYSLAWVAVILVFGAIAALVFTLLDARQMAGLIAMPAGLMFSTVFYVSLLFTYEGCFSSAGRLSPP